MVMSQSARGTTQSARLSKTPSAPASVKADPGSSFRSTNSSSRQPRQSEANDVAFYDPPPRRSGAPEGSFHEVVRSSKRSLSQDHLSTATTAATRGEERERAPSPMTDSPPPLSPRTGMNFLDPAVYEYIEWAVGRPDLIHNGFMLEDRCEYAVRGATGRKGLTAKEWGQLLGRLGFRGDSDAVFNVIAMECRNEREDYRRLGGDGSSRAARHSVFAPTISLSQLRRLEARVAAMRNESSAHDSESPASFLVNLLRRQRGSTLRAFRLDLDQKGAGRVAYTDFARACRKLEVAGQVRSIWNSLCPEGRSLEFGAFDRAEAENLENFAEVIWETHGLDTAKAWAEIDPQRQNWLTLEQFQKGMKRLGFQGDGKLLFRGLDALGLGRVRRSDFEYIGRVTTKSRMTLRQAPGPLTDLITWTQREVGGAEGLIGRLIPSGDEQPEGIQVSDLAARISALGFEGDAVRAAAAAAKFEGGALSGTWISIESLEALLSGNRSAPMWSMMAYMRMQEGRSARPRTQGSRGLPTGAWDGSVNDISFDNGKKCKGTRALFGDHRHQCEYMGPTTARKSFHNRGLAPAGNYYSDAGMSGNRIAWDSGITDVCMTNPKTTSHTKTYFSDPADKPVRNELRAEMAARRGQAHPKYVDDRYS